MKLIVGVFIFGIVIGASVSYFALNTSTSVVGHLQVATSNSNAKIQNTNLTILRHKKIVKVISSFSTDKAGVYTNYVTINKSKLQYNHDILFELGYWLNQKMPYFSFGYQYKSFLMTASVGYSIFYKEFDYGIGIGYSYRF